MTVKTTLLLDSEVFKAAKKMAVDMDTTLSALATKGILVYISDPDGMEETVEILKDKNAMKALLAGVEARSKNKKGYYLDWDKVKHI